MAFNSHIAVASIVLKIRELSDKKRAWVEEAERLYVGEVRLARAGECDASDILYLVRSDAEDMAKRIGFQIDELQQELEAIQAGPNFFRPRK